jgi:hypothetical protein
MNKLTCASTLLAIGLAGCAAPAYDTGSSVDMTVLAGAQPSASEAERVVLEHLRETLKDPDSLKQFRIRSGPKYITWYRGLLTGGGHAAGWLVCFEYNAKNSYGGYVGLKADAIALRTHDSGRAYQVPSVNWPLISSGC